MRIKTILILIYTISAMLFVLLFFIILLPIKIIIKMAETQLISYAEHLDKITKNL